MLRPLLMVVLVFATFFAGSAKIPGVEPDQAQGVIRVVGLDEQGNPQRQGLGVVLDKTGKILTSAGLVTPGRVGVVLTTRGAKYLFQDTLYRDDLQDLAVIKVAGDQLPEVDLGSVKRVQPGEAVRIGLYQEDGVVWQEAQVAKVYPFSPRLILVKLDQPLSEVEPGAPLLDARGNLVGLVHTLAGQGSEAGFKIILALGRKILPREIWMPAQENPPHQEKDLGPKPNNFPPDDRSKNNGTAGSLEKSPDNQIPGPYVLFWQGFQASQDLRWPEARESFSAALTATKELPEAHFGRGVARYHLKDYKGAVQDCLEASRHLPSYALASLWLGKAWEQLGNPSQARKAFEQATQQDPDLKEAWYALGVLDYREGRLDQAQGYLERAGPEVEEAARRAFYLGAIARSRGRLEQARKALDEAIHQDADLFPAYLELGKTLLDMGRPGEAAQILAELVKRDPELSEARYHLALAYLAAWNNKGAWEQYFVLQKSAPALASRLRPVLERGR